MDITIENANDNRPQLVYPRDSDQPILVPLDNNNKSSNTSEELLSSRRLLARLLATDLDSPPRLTYSLQRQSLVRKYPEPLADTLFDLDTNTGSLSLRLASTTPPAGLYVLIVEISDRQTSDDDDDDSVVQKTRVYVFVALNPAEDTTEITRLREVLNKTRLNDNTGVGSVVVSSGQNEEYDDYEDDDDTAKSVDYRLERVIDKMRAAASVRLNKKKTGAGWKIVGGSGDLSTGRSISRLGKLKSQLLHSLNYLNFMPLLLIVIITCVSLAVVFATLCMLSTYYKKRRNDRQRFNSSSDVVETKSSPKHGGSTYHHHQLYSDSSYYDKALGLSDKEIVVAASSSSSTGSTSSHHSSPNSHHRHHQQQTSHHTGATETTTASSASSASPMSLVSAELLVSGAVNGCSVDMVDANTSSSRRLVVKKRTALPTNSSNNTTSTFMSTIDKSKTI